MTTVSISPESPPPWPRLLGLLLLPLALLISACDAGREGDLTPGKPVEREISGGEVHSYRLPVEAGSYMSIRIEQPGTDIKARLEGPEGVSVPDNRGKRAALYCLGAAHNQRGELEAASS